MAAAPPDNSNHVLMVAFAAQGHLNPMLRFAKRLSSKGLTVTLATTEVVRHRMFKPDPTTTPNAPLSISGIQILFFPDGFPLDYERKSNLDLYMTTLAKIGPINLSNLIKSHFPQNLRCIISNPFVPWVVDVAAAFNLPCAMLWIQPCSLFSLYYQFYNNQNLITPNSSNSQFHIPGLPLLHTNDLPSFLFDSNPATSLTQLLMDLFKIYIKKHKWVFANSFFELEKEAVESMAEICPIIPVGPLDLDDDSSGIDLWKPEESCLDWLQKQEDSSVIYISFGSIAVISADLIAAIATALKKTKHPFLWVLKAGILPPGFEEETENQGIVVSWCPQTKVLAHNSVACFITHCGWNSLLETLSAGVPVIGYPQWSDQPTNAKLVVDVFKVGVRIRGGSDGVVAAEEVERCIGEVMGGEKSGELRRNAAEFKRAAREVVEMGGSSDRNIEVFVEEIKRSCVEEKGCTGQ